MRTAQVREGVISYGVSSYGYDLRVADEFRIFTNVNSTIVDPKKFDAKSFVEFKGDVCIVPPNSFALARSMEYFRIPRNVLTICVGQVYVRALRDHRERDAVRAGVGRLRDAGNQQHDAAACEDLRERRTCQVVFFESDEQCETSYKDKKGKYQAQQGIVLPKI